MLFFMNLIFLKEFLMSLQQIFYQNQSIFCYKLLLSRETLQVHRSQFMIKPNQNHISKQCPSLVQIPKPLQHRKKAKENKTRIKSIGYFQNDPSEQAMIKTLILPSKKVIEKGSSIKKFIKNVINRGDMELSECNGQNIFDAFTFTLFGKNGLSGQIAEQEQRRLYVKTQPIQVLQPAGDNQSPRLSCSQLKQAQLFNKSLYASSEKSFEKKQMRSTDRLLNKQKPQVSAQNDIMIQNQILKEENEKLKQLSHQRKNQIGILVKQILQLKYQISNLIDDSESNQHFKMIQKSLNKGIDASSFLYQKSVQAKKERETRQSIAKDIFKKLKQVSYIQDSFLGEEIETK